jgi:hypothetical protein
VRYRQTYLNNLLMARHVTKPGSMDRITALNRRESIAASHARK